jgi:hypothetical protein
VTRTVAPVVAPVAQIVAPVTRTVTRTVAPVANAVAPVTKQLTEAVAPVTRPVMNSIAPVTRPVTKSAAPATETVASNARETSPTAGPETQTGNLVAPAVAPAGRPASSVTTPDSSPVARHRTHASAPLSFGSVTTVLGDSAALPQIDRSAVATASSLAATFAAGLAPRTGCPSCGSAGHSSSPAPVQAPQLPSALFTGAAASAGSGAGGFSLFLVGVLFLTLGAVPRRWTRRRMASASGWPAPYIALSVSPD